MVQPLSPGHWRGTWEDGRLSSLVLRALCDFYCRLLGLHKPLGMGLLPFHREDGWGSEINKLSGSPSQDQTDLGSSFSLLLISRLLPAHGAWMSAFPSQPVSSSLPHQGTRPATTRPSRAPTRTPQGHLCSRCTANPSWAQWPQPTSSESSTACGTERGTRTRFGGGSAHSGSSTLG